MLTLEHLSELLEKNREAAAVSVKEFSIGDRKFAFNSAPALMGVINLSPDSWYRESVCLTTAMAVQRGRVLQAQGAHLIDIGAESSLAHAGRADEILQNSKLLPVLEGLLSAGVTVSVEPYQPEVARQCLKAGAHVLNLTGAGDAEEMYRLVAEAPEAAVIICYVQGS